MTPTHKYYRDMVHSWLHGEFIEFAYMQPDKLFRFTNALGEYAWTPAGFRWFVDASSRMNKSKVSELYDPRSNAFRVAKLIESSHLYARDVGIPRGYQIAPGGSTHIYHANAILMGGDDKLDNQQRDFILGLDLYGKIELGQFPFMNDVDVSGARNISDVATIAAAQIPRETLFLSDEEIDLTRAFYWEILRLAEEESDGRPPLMGDFTMRMPDLPAATEMGAEWMRLIISDTGIWVSVLLESGVAFGYWQPSFDNLHISFGHKHSWVMRVLCACIWHDAKVVKHRAFRRSSNRGGESVQRGLMARTITLPRNIYQLDWVDPEYEVSGANIPSERNVRAHYRQLPDGWKMRRGAENAARYGWPMPPPGYTFVSPHDAVEIPESERPRLVCRGLQTARVVLSKVG